MDRDNKPIKVITYGTYDLLHYGHIRLLERARALGDYLIVGITSDDFDKARGKINVQQSLTERIGAVRATGLADEIIIEEYEGQKIDDIRRYDVDIFTVGSDWNGHFDYLNEYCKVVYLERTQGVSSTQIRSKERNLHMGIVGDNIPVIEKFLRESEYVNGIEITTICVPDGMKLTERLSVLNRMDYESMLNEVEAIYVVNHPNEHDYYIRAALEKGKHVLCETPVSMNEEQCRQLLELAKSKECILLDGIKTAYSLAYERLLLLMKTGVIGDIISVDATCTSLKPPVILDANGVRQWGSMASWASFGLLAVFSLLGCDYKEVFIQSKVLEEDYDLFSKIDFIYENAVASVKVGNGVKSEGELVISGTKGYVYVPSPWWKTDYFEVRFENPQDNRRYFYQLDGEGIRYMIVCFLKSIAKGKNNNVSDELSVSISRVMDDFKNRRNVTLI